MSNAQFDGALIKYSTYRALTGSQNGCPNAEGPVPEYDDYS